MANTTLTQEQVKFINETKEVLGQLDFYLSKLESLQNEWDRLGNDTIVSRIAWSLEKISEMLDKLRWSTADDTKWAITKASNEVDKLIKTISGQPITDECYYC